MFSNQNNIDFGKNAVGDELIHDKCQWIGILRSVDITPLHLVYNFGDGCFPNCIFPRATSQLTISQVGISQMCIFPSDNFPMVRLGLLRRRRL